MNAQPLNTENYQDGYLIDTEWMGGISPSPQNSMGLNFEAFILDYQSGQTIASHSFHTLEDAIAALNRIPRPWTFENFSECGNGQCGKSQKCGTECCPKKKQKNN